APACKRLSCFRCSELLDLSPARSVTERGRRAAIGFQTRARTINMKIPTKGTSRFLGQADVPAPFTAVIDRVTIDQTLRNPFVLHFAGGTVKPLPLNVINRRTLVTAYGDDDAHWRGRSIEIYVDPNVTNSRGETVGGIRLRIPQQTPTNRPSPPA